MIHLLFYHTHFTEIQKAMAMLIETFHKYSGKEGDKTTSLDPIFFHFLLTVNSRNTMSVKVHPFSPICLPPEGCNQFYIQKGMAMLIAAFHKYSGKEGDKTTLSKGELKDLLTAELGDILGKSQDKAALDKIFKDLDANADGSVDFQEYVTLIACITMLCNEFFTKK
uniref:Ictacalcin n=1 Tax=Cyprinus carpio TaxID=7962 RepID=A0A8C1NVJ5_CYPCA